MKRALLMVCLLASPTTAQVSPYVNPYNPYGSSTSSSSIQFRPYVSLDRLHIQHQYRPMPPNYIAMGGKIWNVANMNTHAAAFRYFPNYPALNSSPNGSRALGTSTAKGMQPLPLTAPQPVEIACDPYKDEDGCMSEYADW